LLFIHLHDVRSFLIDNFQGAIFEKYMSKEILPTLVRVIEEQMVDKQVNSWQAIVHFAEKSGLENKICERVGQLLTTIPSELDTNRWFRRNLKVSLRPLVRVEMKCWKIVGDDALRHSRTNVTFSCAQLLRELRCVPADDAIAKSFRSGNSVHPVDFFCSNPKPPLPKSLFLVWLQHLFTAGRRFSTDRGQWLTYRFDVWQ